MSSMPSTGSDAVGKSSSSSHLNNLAGTTNAMADVNNASSTGFLMVPLSLLPSSPKIVDLDPRLQPMWRSLSPAEMYHHGLPPLQPLLEPSAEFPEELRPLLGVWNHADRNAMWCAMEMQLQPDFTFERVALRCKGLHKLKGDARPKVQPAVASAATSAAAASVSVASNSASESVYPCLVCDKMFVIAAHTGHACSWAPSQPSAKGRAELNLPPTQRTTADLAESFKDLDDEIRSTCKRTTRPGAWKNWCASGKCSC